MTTQEHSPKEKTNYEERNRNGKETYSTNPNLLFCTHFLLILSLLQMGHTLLLSPTQWYCVASSATGLPPPCYSLPGKKKGFTPRHCYTEERVGQWENGLVDCACLSTCVVVNGSPTTTAVTTLLEAQEHIGSSLKNKNQTVCL